MFYFSVSRWNKGIQLSFSIFLTWVSVTFLCDRSKFSKVATAVFSGWYLSMTLWVHSLRCVYLLWGDQHGEGDSEDVLFWLLTIGSVMDRTLGLVRPKQVLCHWAIPSEPVVCVLMPSHERSVFWFSAEVLTSSCHQFPVCEWPSLGIVPTSKLGCMLTLWDAIIIPFSPSPVCRFEI